MNRLFGLRCYKIGAMDRVEDGGVAWRQSLKPFLNSLGVVVFDPTNKPINIGIEDEEVRTKINEYKQKGRLEDAATMMQPIRRIDLRMVDVVDFVIAHINVNTHMAGSYEEITLANRQKKPVLIHVEQGREHTPNWVLGMLGPKGCHEIFSRWDDLKRYLSNLNEASSKEVDYYYNRHRRWVFFDLKKIINEAKNEIL